MSNKDFQFFFAGFIPQKDKLLLISYANFLMEFDLNNSELQFVQSMNTEVCGMLAPYHAERFLQVGKSLLATSMWGQNVYLYDTESDRWDILEIDCHQKEWGNFLGIFVREECVYFVPRYREYIIRIHPETKEIFRLNCSMISKLDVENVIPCMKDEFLYFFDGTNACVLIYHLRTRKYEAKKIDGITGRISAVQYYKKRFFILFASGKTGAWNEQDNTLETVIEPIDETRPISFGQFAVTDQNIWLFPALGEDIYVYDYGDKIKKRYEEYPEKLEYMDFENYYKFLPGIRYEDKIYFGMHCANHLLCIDVNTGKEEWFYPKLPTQRKADTFRRYHGLSVEEQEKDTSLIDFLNRVPKVEDDGMTYVWKRKMIGSDIWEKLGE